MKGCVGGMKGSGGAEPLTPITISFPCVPPGHADRPQRHAGGPGGAHGRAAPASQLHRGHLRPQGRAQLEAKPGPGRLPGAASDPCLHDRPSPAAAGAFPPLPSPGKACHPPLRAAPAASASLLRAWVGRGEAGDPHGVVGAGGGHSKPRPSLPRRSPEDVAWGPKPPPPARSPHPGLWHPPAMLRAGVHWSPLPKASEPPRFAPSLPISCPRAWAPRGALGPLAASGLLRGGIVRLHGLFLPGNTHLGFDHIRVWDLLGVWWPHGR